MHKDTFPFIYFWVTFAPSLSLWASVGKKNKLRLYYLSWLRNKILHNDPEVEKRQGWTSVGDLEGCVHYKVGEYKLRGEHGRVRKKCCIGL